MIKIGLPQSCYLCTVMKFGQHKAYKTAAKRLMLYSPQHAQWQLRLVIDRLNSSSARVPTKEREASGFYGWREVDTTEARSELRRIVDQWLAAGKKFEAALDENADLRKMCENSRVMLLPDRDGNVQVAFLPQLVPRVAPARNSALHLFINLLINPFAAKLSGPCSRCGFFFENETSRVRVYCSKKCSSAATSKQTHAELKAKIEAERLREVALSTIRFKKARTRKTWKEWVSGETTISKNWLTRAVSKGILTAP